MFINGVYDEIDSVYRNMCYKMIAICLDIYQQRQLFAKINRIEEQCYKTYCYICSNKKRKIEDAETPHLLVKVLV